MGYSGETNDINFSSGTTAFYGFLGFLINGEDQNFRNVPGILTHRLISFGSTNPVFG
jgi:hypothetical protein